MHHMKRERQIAISKSRAFCRSCTLHGVHYFSERQHWTVYVIWSVILLASISLCAFLCNMIWIKFSTDPTFTVVESTHYSTTSVAFPAVTVCDPAVVYGPNTYNITDILVRRGYSDIQIEEFYASFSNVHRADYHPPVYVSKMHKVLNELGFTMDMLLDMLAKPCDVLLELCLWRDKKHNCSDMFKKVHTIVGYCCKFEMKFFRNNADPDTNFVAGIEVNEALSLVLNGDVVSFNGTTSDGYVYLYVYDDTTNINLMTSPAVITASGFFDISLLVWVIESSDDVHTLSISNRKCIIDSELIPNGGKHTYQQDCLMKIILKTAANFCRCLPFNFKAHILQVDDYPACNWDRVMCIFRKIEEVQSNIKDILFENECYQRCDYTQYDTKINYMKYVRTIKTKYEDLSTVSVHHTSNTCLKYQREVLYTWDQMLANIGGIFGLCLGGSIISILELLWFITDLIYTFFINARRRKTSPNKNHNIFTVMEKNMTINYNHISKTAKKTMKYKFAD